MSPGLFCSDRRTIMSDVDRIGHDCEFWTCSLELRVVGQKLHVSLARVIAGLTISSAPNSLPQHFTWTHERLSPSMILYIKARRRASYLQGNDSNSDLTRIFSLLIQPPAPTSQASHLLSTYSCLFSLNIQYMSYLYK